MPTLAVMYRSAPMPSALCRNRLDSNTPPAASGRNATVIATCTTITVVQTPPNRSPERAAPSLRSASCTFRFVTRSAGRIPMIAAPNSVSIAVYTTVFHDRLSLIQNGIPSLAASRLTPQRSETFARSSPTNAATPTSTSASMNSWEMMRPRLAPIALRTVISQPRVAVRANTSVATFVEMIASSIRKMPFTTYSTFLIMSAWPPSPSGLAYVVTRGRRSLWVSG